MKKSLLTLATLSLGAFTMLAQDAAPQRPDGPRPGFRPGGPRGEGMRPNLPVLAALDANKDGVIDANEIANASAALKALDKNGDGQLTHDEIMPPRPEGAGVPGEGRGPGRGRPGPDRQPPAP
jgi:hypothetical protein